MSEEQHDTMRKITESFWCCRKNYVMAKPMLGAGFHELKIQIQQTLEDMKKIAKMSRDTSIEHQQSVTEIHFVRNEINAVKDTSNELRKSTAAMENKIGSFEKTNKNLNRIVTFSNYTKKNQIVTKRQHRKVQQRTAHRNAKQSSSLPTPKQAT